MRSAEMVEGELARCGRTMVPVSGDSMGPTIASGSVVPVITLRLPPVAGRIYLYRWRDRYCLHRCVAVWESRVVLMGDGATRPHVVDKNDLIGEYPCAASRICVLLITVVNRFFLQLLMVFPRRMRRRRRQKSRLFLISLFSRMGRRHYG